MSDTQVNRPQRLPPRVQHRPPGQPPTPPPPSRPPRVPAQSAGYIPWWLLGIVAFGFMLAAGGLLLLVVLTRPADLPRPTATAQVVTVPAVIGQPTATLEVPGAATAAPPTDTPPDTPPPPPPGEVHVGAYVQVVGTGDAGFLNLRAEPSLEAAVNYLAIENEVLQVQAGPTSAGGFTWWYLVDPATNSRFGWAVQNYLQVVQGP